MWKDLKDLHKLGILVRDIKVFNYLDGKLVDFSRAWTTPHPSYYESDLDPSLVRSELDSDASKLDWEMFEWDYNLGDRSKLDYHESDLRLYDWLKWEKDPDSAEAFMQHKIWEDESEDEDEEIVIVSFS